MIAANAVALLVDLDRSRVSGPVLGHSALRSTYCHPPGAYPKLRTRMTLSGSGSRLTSA